MDRINDEIRNIDIEKGISKESAADTFHSEKRNIENKLAKSALKGLTKGKQTMKFLKSALGRSVQNTKKSISPRIMLRSNTLINFQV